MKGTEDDVGASSFGDYNSSLVADGVTADIMSNNTDSASVKVIDVIGPQVETNFEFGTDIFLGVLFLITTIVAAKRMVWSQRQGGAETTVVTAFYSLILLTSALRAVWFIIPKAFLKQSYTPHAVMAYEPEWVGAFISDILVSTGSLCLFSIFILILVYWADILKKYFFPGVRRTKPMVTFVTLVVALALVLLANAVLFLCKVYSSEGMLLVNSVMLATVSIVCVVEINLFSNRFRTVLMTLGAINQVSTDSQVKRIMWITHTGNAFFLTRALLEVVFALTLIVYWFKHGTVEEVMTHSSWDTYIWIKHMSEVAILVLMLYILQSRFTTAATQGRDGYQQVPDAVEGEEEESESAKDVKAMVV